MAVEPVDLAEITDGDGKLCLLLLDHYPSLVALALLVLLDFLMELLIVQFLLCCIWLHLLICYILFE